MRRRRSRSEPVLSMKAGDLVRIGGVETEGFTDYLTVLEVRHITTLANGTDENVSISKATTRIANIVDCTRHNNNCRRRNTL